jgi:hypothetical protein
LQFDYTYIFLWGLKIFEPVTILTNFLITGLCIFIFLGLKKYKNYISRNWSLFFLFLGISSFVGSFGHAAHHEWGMLFFNVVSFFNNALSFISIYFCYYATTATLSSNKIRPKKIYNYLVIIWFIAMLIITIILNKFLIIKIHAGLVLTYSLIAHIITYREKLSGSGRIALGIAISFLSILIHSLRISISEWFNYKDIAHVIMMISLFLMYQGIALQLNNSIKKKVTVKSVIAK